MNKGIRGFVRSASRERAYSREANFGSGRKDGLSSMFGKLSEEYEIYKSCAPAPHKSFDEWLNS